MSEAIKENLPKIKGKKVAVFGDIMLDKYTLGEVLRISPEAPVPVLKKVSEKLVLGGAANVANNIVSLGAKADMFGVVGNDVGGDAVFALFKKGGIGSDGVFVHDKKPTTVKHRIVSGVSHQMLRIDEEDAGNLEQSVENEILKRFRGAAPETDIVILSDYNKGVLSKTLVAGVLRIAKEFNKKIFADFKPVNKEIFIGVDLVSPNIREGAEITGVDSVEEMGARLVEYFNADAMLTRGGDGISVFSREEGSHRHIPGKKIKVFDVSGAGDTTIAVAAIASAAGMTIEDAAFVANSAGAIVVQKPGTATVSFEELESALRLDGHVESVDIVPKVWGYEKWLENNDKYCSKLLSLNKGYQCSLHYHKVKDEMFLVTKGHVRLELGDEVIHLRDGNFIRIPPGTKHRFTGIEDSLIMEVSTHHDEGDSCRLEESKRVA